MTISDYTVIYRDCNGSRCEFYLAAKSLADATMSATELLPDCVEIVRVYHDPNWH